MSNRYDLVIFDLDGTLVNSASWFRSNLNVVAARHGFRQIDDAEIDTLRGQSSRAILAHLEIPLWKMPFIAHSLRKMMASNIDQIRLFEGVDALLAHLAKCGVLIAVATSNAEANARRILGESNAKLVDHFACGASFFGKANVFRSVVKQLGADPRRSLAVGDEARDIEAARKAGLAVGAVSWGYATAELLQSQQPDHLFLSIADIQEAVNQDYDSTR
jgi:phosphoglycolate phosphatase